MIGKLKTAETSATVRQLSVLPELPRLQVGSDYLLITTPPSTIGLSITVGLGQGLFQLSGKPGQELAINGNAQPGALHRHERGLAHRRDPAGQRPGALFGPGGR